MLCWKRGADSGRYDKFNVLGFNIVVWGKSTTLFVYIYVCVCMYEVYALDYDHFAA
jgi:hypothetical protein